VQSHGNNSEFRCYDGQEKGILDGFGIPSRHN